MERRPLVIGPSNSRVKPARASDRLELRLIHVHNAYIYH